MPRDITIHFSDGTAHQYNNAPDVLTPDDIEKRIKKDYPNKKIVKIDGGKKSNQQSELDQIKKNAGVEINLDRVFNNWGSLGTSPKIWLKELPLNSLSTDNLIDKLGAPTSMKTIGSTTYMKYKWGSAHSSITFHAKGDIIVDARFDPEWQELDKISQSDNLPSNVGRATLQTLRLTGGFSSDKTSRWNTEPVTAKQMQGN